VVAFVRALRHYVPGRIHHVGVIADPAGQGVVAGASIQRVVAGATGERVAAGTSHHRVGPRAADDRVVARPALDARDVHQLRAAEVQVVEGCAVDADDVHASAAVDALHRVCVVILEQADGVVACTAEDLVETVATVDPVYAVARTHDEEGVISTVAV